MFSSDVPYVAFITYVPESFQSMFGVNDTLYVPIDDGDLCSIANTLFCESVIVKVICSPVTGETFPVALIVSLL